MGDPPEQLVHTGDEMDEIVAPCNLELDSPERVLISAA